VPEGANVLDDEDRLISEMYDPDEMPSLEEATRILFGRSHGSTGTATATTTTPAGGMAWGEYAWGEEETTPAPAGTKRDTKSVEEEWEQEMRDRLSEFLTVPPSTPDLAAHLEDMSERYPAAPVERAALRFCEAVALWRGKPELETYKRSTSSNPTISIDSLIHHAPPPKPPINRYFMIPKHRRTSTHSTHHPESSDPTRIGRGIGKRTRNGESDYSRRGGKKIAVEGGQAWVEPDQYVGPYGV